MRAPRAPCRNKGCNIVADQKRTWAPARPRLSAHHLMLPARVKWRMQGVEREIGMTQLWIAAGGALGSLLRYWVTLLTAAWLGERMPWGTILINISGSLVIGVIAAMAESGGRWALSPDIRLFLMVGICGGYTTFSSFSLQTLDLLRSGAVVRATVNIAGSVALCVAAVAVGHAVASHFNGGSRQIAQAAIEEEG